MLLKGAVLGVVEGLTEFLPISSTGHLILAASLVRFHEHAAKVFEITIQTGAIFAVIWQYRARLGATVAGIATDRTDQRFVLNLLIAFLPAAVVGLLLASLIKRALFQPMVVAAAFIVGGVIILWLENRSRRSGKPDYRVQRIEEITPADALKIGLAQCLASFLERAARELRSSAPCSSACRGRRPRSSASILAFRRSSPRVLIHFGRTAERSRRETFRYSE